MIKCYSPYLDEKRGWDVETGRGSGEMCEDHKRTEASDGLSVSFGEVSGANYR